MTAEYLLRAIGLLDDELIEDALRPAAQRPALLTRLRRWSSLAACLALLLTAGYIVTHLGMGGGSSGSSSAAAGEPSPDTGDGTANGSSGGTASSPSGGTAPAQEPGTIFLENTVYLFTGETLSALPEDALALAQLSALAPDAPSPSTDREDYVGCPVFQSADGRQLYVQRDDGLWAVAAMAEP